MKKYGLIMALLVCGSAVGLLRSELPHLVRETVTHEIGREYSQGSDAEIRTKILTAVRDKTAGPKLAG